MTVKKEKVAVQVTPKGGKKVVVASSATRPPVRQAGRRGEKVVKTTGKKAIVSKLRIKVVAYEYKILDTSVKQIMDTAFRLDAKVRGPVPLPTAIKKYTVNRSSFIYKDAREQFEMRVHKRLIDIISPSKEIIEALTNLNLPAGVDVDVKLI